MNHLYLFLFRGQTSQQGQSSGVYAVFKEILAKEGPRGFYKVPSTLTLHPAPCTLHLAPSTLHLAPRDFYKVRFPTNRELLTTFWGLLPEKLQAKARIWPLLYRIHVTAALRNPRPAPWTLPRSSP